MRQAPATVDDYLASVAPRFRPLLRRVRATIKRAAPQAVESISYGIPTYQVQGRRLIYFSAASEHCTIHMIRREHLEYAVRRGFKIGRGSIQFTLARPLPDAFLSRIVEVRLKEIRASGLKELERRGLVRKAEGDLLTARPIRLRRGRRRPSTLIEQGRVD